MSRAPWIVAGVVTVAAGAAVATAINLQPIGTPAAAARPKAPKTAPVVRTTLVESKDVDGTLAYPSPASVPNRLGGTVTSVPSEGSIVKRGRALYRIDDRPVVLLYGSLPAYRALREGSEGRDVRQLERNLRALGYKDFTVDDEFTARTKEVVEDWQEDVGLSDTGVVEPGRVVYTSGSVRIHEVLQQKGTAASPSQSVVSYTTGRREVTAELDVVDQDLARVGQAVTVELPGGTSVKGKIVDIGTTASAPATQSGQQQQAGAAAEDAKLEVTVSLADQKMLGRLEEAPVTVQFVADTRPDVLAVPVGALLALREGGYGVEIVDGSRTSIVKVTVGMFANGNVEVSSPRLREGLQVGVPSV